MGIYNTNEMDNINILFNSGPDGALMIRDEKGNIIVPASKADIENLINKPKLDFLLVDYWRGESDSEIPTATGQLYVVYSGEELNVVSVGISKLVEENLTFCYLMGNRSYWNDSYQNENIPSIPISQNTIFVHPTTFERYRFNGTTMEVYLDVNKVVPDFLHYEALLTQSGTDAPVARVLNADERNYLKIDWVNNSPDINANISFDYKLMTYIGSKQDSNNSSDTFIHYSKDSGIIIISNGDSGDITDYPISIKQRLRGAPPVLVSAETNTTGDKVILTFSKKMSGYNLSEFVNAITFSGLNNVSSSNIVFSVIDNTIIISLIDGVVSLDNPNPFVGFDGSVSIESLDYGLLQPFENIPVTNNVTSPPQLLDAYTNEDGSQITLEFDKNMEDNTPQPLYMVGVNGQVSIAWESAVANLVYVGFNENATSGAIIKLNYPSDGSWKSSDGGIVAEFYDFPVTNNVIL
jgi:hypothetical protein